MATEETISNLVLRHAWIGITLFKIVKNNLYSLMKIIHKVPFAVSICNRILKYRVWKIEFDELDFLSISNSNFAGYTGSKNLVQTRQKFQFIKLDFSNSIFQNPSGDRYRASLLNDHIRKVNFTHRQILLPAVSKSVKIVDNDHTNVHKTPQTRFYLDHKR